jgi:L-rhamnose mutarotase
MSCTYLMKVIPETCHARTWWRLFQKHVMHVPDEGFSRNMSCTYLMKVIPETCHARTWWRLFQKHVMHVPDEGCFWNNLHQVCAWHVSGITFIRYVHDMFLE